MKTTNQFLLAILTLLLSTSCNKEDKPDPIESPLFFNDGVFVVNEGPYLSGSGTISFYNYKNDSVVQDVFEEINDFSLGNIVQSMSIHNNRAYIVVNNASKVEIVDLLLFQWKTTINDLSSPRNFLGVSKDKAYITDWGNNSVAILNLSTHTVTSIIETKGSGPEEMVYYNGYLWVTNSGGWDNDSTIAVIDTETDSLKMLLEIGDNPKGIYLDVNNKIWVLCSGKGWDAWAQSTDTKGRLIRINPDDYSLEATFEFPATDYHPYELIINHSKDILYYIYNGGIYEFNITDMEIASSPLLTGNFYSIGIDNNSKYIYAADPKDYVQDGWVSRYDISSGNVVDSFKVGIAPGAFCFTE